MIEKFANCINDKNKNYIIFDVGSRDCQQSIEFYKTFPNAKIYAFECNPNTLGICEQNIVPYQDRITLIKGAVCDYDGDITFYPIDQEKTMTTWKDGNPGASSLYKSNGKYTVEKYVQNEITTNCHRLDTIMNEYEIPCVDIIWMDLQGAELLALRGLGNKLSSVEYIHTEVSHKEMYTGQVMYKELNDFVISNHFQIVNRLSLQGWQEDVIYKKRKNIAMITFCAGLEYKTNELMYLDMDHREYSLFDIVIPVGPNDKSIIEEQIKYTKQNIIGYRNIYLICYDPSIEIDGCITINENIFPFNIDTVASYHGKLERNGWYLQQLLKLYSGKIIPGILDRYLVIDSDTFFLKPTIFVENDKCLYNYGIEYHKPYFEHMKKMDKNLIKIDAQKSGICHHMIFEKKYVDEMFSLIEKNHNDLFYKVFLQSITVKSGSGASEYEMYFNYMLKYNPDKIKLRRLNWKNTNKLDMNNNLDYISYHWYMRK